MLCKYCEYLNNTMKPFTAIPKLVSIFGFANIQISSS
jgi:hypothetical protein